MKRLVFPAVVIFAIYFGVFGGEYSVFEVRKARSELIEQETVLPLVMRQIDSLQARVDSLENDDAALERFGRERYGLVREGEFLYRLSEPDSLPVDESKRE